MKVMKSRDTSPLKIVIRASDGAFYVLEECVVYAAGKILRLANISSRN